MYILAENPPMPVWLAITILVLFFGSVAFIWFKLEFQDKANVKYWEGKKREYWGKTHKHANQPSFEQRQKPNSRITNCEIEIGVDDE